MMCVRVRVVAARGVFFPLRALFFLRKSVRPGDRSRKKRTIHNWINNSKRCITNQKEINNDKSYNTANREAI
jgi:hypothetical protein